MKTTLMQRGAATVLPVSGSAWGTPTPAAAPVRGTAVSVAVRLRHTGDAFAAAACDAVAVDTSDAGLVGSAVAAPPPRGAPV